MNTVHSAARPGLRERKKLETRSRIRDAATALFLRHGFSGTTVDAIAARAGVSKPTFFNYFSSKLAIVQELVEITHTQFVTYIEESMQAEASTSKRLRDVLVRSAEYLERQPEFTRLTLVEALGAIGEPEAARARFDRLHGAMGRLLEAGVARGEVRRDYPVPLLVRMLVGGYFYTILDWVSNGEQALGEAMREAADFLADMLAPA